MDKHYLVMKWDYEYNKEGEWFDISDKETRYELVEGASYALPELSRKSLEIRSISTDGELVSVEIYVDSQTFTVSNSGEPIVKFAHNSYSVAGDSVSGTLRMELTIE